MALSHWVKGQKDGSVSLHTQSGSVHLVGQYMVLSYEVTKMGQRLTTFTVGQYIFENQLCRVKMSASWVWATTLKVGQYILHDSLCC